MLKTTPLTLELIIPPPSPSNPQITYTVQVTTGITTVIVSEVPKQIRELLLPLNVKTTGT